MSIYKLKSGLFQSPARLVLTPTWVSNGVWAIRRECLEPMVQAVLGTVQGAQAWAGRAQVHETGDTCIDQGVREATEEWKVTTWIVDFPTTTGKVLLLRVLQHPRGVAAVDKTYCDLLGIRAGDVVLGGAPTTPEEVDQKMVWAAGEPRAGCPFVQKPSEGEGKPEWVVMSMSMSDNRGRKWPAAAVTQF